MASCIITSLDPCHNTRALKSTDLPSHPLSKNTFQNGGQSWGSHLVWLTNSTYGDDVIVWGILSCLQVIEWPTLLGNFLIVHIM